MQLQQKSPGALDIRCGSRWGIIHLHPNSWASKTVAHTVEGPQINCVLPGDWGRSGHVLVLLQQMNPRRRSVRGGLGTAGTYVLEMLTPRVPCVFLNGLPACVGRGRIPAAVWIQLRKGLPSMAACGSRAPGLQPGGPFQPCTCLGCADLPDAFLEPGFAILCLLCLLQSFSMLLHTLGKSARPSALGELGLWEAKLLLVVAACSPGSMRAGC